MKGNAISKLEAFVSMDWLEIRHMSMSRFHASVRANSWSFDGNFQQNRSSIEITERLPSLIDDFDIKSLSLYPIKFAAEDTIESLRCRGRMFWDCRGRNYVCYKGVTDKEISDAVSAPSRDINLPFRHDCITKERTDKLALYD